MMNSSQLYPSSLPESDLELLSAYLDRQLSVGERVKLERRIEAEPALRAELESLRETAAALRALEQLRPPRSFTLDPATAPKPRFYFPIAWVMQLGSGLAGLALVLLATVQMISVGAVPATMPAPMAAEEAPTLAGTATAFPTLEAAAAQAPQASDAAAMREAAPTTATAAPEISASVLMEAAPMATPQAAPPAGEPEPVAAPTTAPTAEAPAADPASTTALAIPEAAPPPAGGTASGPVMNSSPAGGMGAAGGTAEGAVQSTDTSSPDTASLPEAQPEQRGEVEILPGLTLAVGMALIGLGLVWHLYSRRSW